MRSSISKMLTFAVLVLRLLQGTALSQAPDSDMLLDSNAKAKAAQFLQERFHKCGEYYFSKHSSPDSESSSFSVYQYKGWGWKIVRQPVSEIDKLNGTDWRAEIAVQASAFKEYSDDEEGWQREWFDWAPFYGISFQQERTKGIWKIDDISHDNYGKDPITCGEVEKLLACPDGKRCL